MHGSLLPAYRKVEAADLACTNAYPNPRPLERAAIRTLLQRAWEGVAPR